MFWKVHDPNFQILVIADVDFRVFCSENSLIWLRFSILTIFVGVFKLLYFHCYLELFDNFWCFEKLLIRTFIFWNADWLLQALVTTIKQYQWQTSKYSFSIVAASILIIFEVLKSCWSELSCFWSRLVTANTGYD